MFNSLHFQLPCASTRTLVEKFFTENGEPEKAQIWWVTPNPLLGGIAPVQMVEMDRAEKLLRVFKRQPVSSPARSN